MKLKKIESLYNEFSRRGYWVEDGLIFNIFFVVVKDGDSYKVAEFSGRKRLNIEIYPTKDQDINTDKTSEDLFRDIEDLEYYFTEE